MAKKPVSTAPVRDILAPAPQVRFGGSFAPPLSDDKVAAYKELAASADSQTKEAMLLLINMCEKFSETPESKLSGSPHPSGTGVIVPLEPDEIARMDPHVPWNEELEMFNHLFEKIDNETHKPLRDAAFHLLWFGRELFLDRQPLTSDRLAK